jgi:hypothetical protein
MKGTGRSGVVAQAVEHPFCNYKALSSTPVPPEKNELQIFELESYLNR